MFLMLSGGGLTTIETACRFPIRLVESGPAGGVILAGQIARECDLPAALAYTPGAPIVENLMSWVRFTLVTSLGYDIPRAVLTVTLILIAGAPILNALRRVSRRAVFDPQPTFVPIP